MFQVKLMINSAVSVANFHRWRRRLVLFRQFFGKRVFHMYRGLITFTPGVDQKVDFGQLAFCVMSHGVGLLLIEIFRGK